MSWTSACYIIDDEFAEAMIGAYEDPMTLNGNPHPMPGELQPPENFWVLPPYPALGWNDVPQPAEPEEQPQPNP